MNEEAIAAIGLESAGNARLIKRSRSSASSGVAMPAAFFSLMLLLVLLFSMGKEGERDALNGMCRGRCLMRVMCILHIRIFIE